MHSLDESTMKNRRYMDIDIHGCSRVDGLGLIRIHGCMPAEEGVEMIEAHLQKFGLAIEKDILGIASDGAALIKNVEKNLAVTHQACHNHGLHVAVTLVLYWKKIQMDELDEDKEDVTEKEDEEGHEDEGNRILACPLTLQEDEDLSDEYLPIIKKVRIIEETLRKSPVKNDAPQRICQANLGKKLALISDCKTHWKSMFNMIHRFLHMRKVVSKALLEADLEELLLSEEETEKLSDLSEALELLDCGSNALAWRDCTLRKADQVFEYVLMSLKAQASSISMQLHDTTKEGIEERRLRIMAGLMLFLKDPEEYSAKVQDPEPVLLYPSKMEICQGSQGALHQAVTSTSHGRGG